MERQIAAGVWLQQEVALQTRIQHVCWHGGVSVRLRQAFGCGRRLR
jgi:hypothetical protein